MIALFIPLIQQSLLLILVSFFWGKLASFGVTGTTRWNKSMCKSKGPAVFIKAVGSDCLHTYIQLTAAPWKTQASHLSVSFPLANIERHQCNNSTYVMNSSKTIPFFGLSPSFRGGLELRISGTYLDSIQKPKIYIIFPSSNGSQTTAVQASIVLLLSVKAM